MDLCYLGRADEAVERILDARRRIEACGTARELTHAYLLLCDVLIVTGRMSDAARAGLEGIAVARRLGLERSHGIGLAVEAATGLVETGDWERAEEVLATATRLGGTFWPHRVEMLRAELELARGELERARRHLDAAAAGATRPFAAAPYARLVAELALWEGRVDDAVRAVDDGIRLASPDEQPRLYALALRAPGGAGSTRRRPPRPQQQSPQRGHGRRSSSTRRAKRRPRPPPSRRKRSRGPASPKRSSRGWTDPRRRRGTPRPQRSTSSTGPTCRRTAGGVRPRHTSTRAPRGARRLCPRVRRTRSREACAHGSCKAGSSSSRNARGSTSWSRRSRYEPRPLSLLASELGITAREAEVLELVARGYTNREIGESLYVSAKTASVHVTNILRKLGVSSRREAAAVAQRVAETF